MIQTVLDFEKLISQENTFNSRIFHLPKKQLKIFSFKSNWITFENCTFNCDTLSIKNIINPDLTLVFRNCTFNCSVDFKNCSFDQLTINETKAIKSLDIRAGLSESDVFELNTFQFANVSDNDPPELETNFHISNITIKKTFSFENIKHIKGKFKFLENALGNKEKNDSLLMLNNSTLSNAFFYKNTFHEFISFYNTIFHYNTEYLRSTNAGYFYTRFYDNTFNKVDFSETTFDKLIEFENCDFLNKTWLEDCKNLTNSHLKFIACKFEKHILFDNSKFNKLEILYSKFLEKASFENFETNYFKIHQVTFAGGAYFDDLNKNNNSVIENWDRKTIRTIKQELQKTENRIDFNRFRAYELAAHYQELDWKWNSGFIDKSILFATKISTDFGNSWRKALRFTIVGGFIIYLLLYIIENRNFSIDIFNWNNWERLLSGFFRFLLVTDFYNPLETNRIYLTNPFSWLILIFGKIVVAFGIYEMIQSFRKFKA